MNNRIDVNEIMKELEEKIKSGLSEKRLTLTDISILIGEHIGKAKEKILKDTGELIGEEVPSSNEDTCSDCGGRLKKTKK